MTVRWKHSPDGHDFPAALDYLALLMPADEAAALVKQLRQAPTVEHPAKDILRAADDERLPYPKANEHTAKQLARIAAGKRLSPVLLVAEDRRHIIADGSHRVSAAWWCGEDTLVRCRIAYR